MNEIEHEALTAFQAVVDRDQNFRPRAGQRRMAEEVARTLSAGSLGDTTPIERRIAVIEAGTGVGKSLAASVPAIVAALRRETRVIISTATVALQEQLMQKDLPHFASLMTHPFRYALAKGRGRYVCKTKLLRFAGLQQEASLDLFDDAEEEGDQEGAGTGAAAVSESTVVLYKELAHDLQAAAWDGERDTLQTPLAAKIWPRIAADRHTCTGRKCPQYNECAFMAARKTLADADVIVANHDLLLASLGSRVLPDLKDTLLILDEGHELAEIASSQFAFELDLTNLRWIDQLGKRIRLIGAEIGYPGAGEALELARQLKSAMSDMQTLSMSLFSTEQASRESILRLPHGEVPEGLQEPLQQLDRLAKALLKHLGSLAELLNEQMKQDPGQQAKLGALYAALGAMAPRVEAVVNTMSLLLEEGEVPNAKWFALDESAGHLRVRLHASQLTPAASLVDQLWQRVRSAVITSATLTSCGSFDYFLSEVGLDQVDGVSTLKVQSPFDYARQGRLQVIKTRNNPRQIEAYNQEVVERFLVDADQVQAGALALFTSRQHLQNAHKAMPEDMASRVLVQGSMSRAALLAEHRRRVDAGQPSIIMGLQSFGQGVDLPGAYCATVFIAKLPFAPPSDPIADARSEWLKAQNREPFNELVLPAVSIRLNQWAGRLIRSEEDMGTIVCYDSRLTNTGYGRRILSGMPAFAVHQG